MSPKIIGIAGGSGSGSGKSTLAVSLCKNHPEACTLVHLDDYFKHTRETPMRGEFVNFDHPDSVRFDDLYRDLLSLKNGNPIKVLTNSELYNPEYDHRLKNRIEYTIEPKEILILEGYLALHDKRIRDVMDYKIYLDIPVEESSKRRSANKFAPNEKYHREVLVPMHTEFVEPTKAMADLVIDVSNKTPEEVCSIVEALVFQK